MLQELIRCQSTVASTSRKVPEWLPGARTAICQSVAGQRQTAVTTYLKSKQLLLFAFALCYRISGRSATRQKHNSSLLSYQVQVILFIDFPAVAEVIYRRELTLSARGPYLDVRI